FLSLMSLGTKTADVVRHSQWAICPSKKPHIASKMRTLIPQGYRMGRPKLDPADREVIPRSKDKLNPTGRKVLSLHLRGLRTKEIATALGLCEQHVAKVMRERRYLEALDAKLDLIDDEFLRLKPDALRALANGLRSSDEPTALRAS